jgi:hypothetical protein
MAKVSVEVSDPKVSIEVSPPDTEVVIHDEWAIINIESDTTSVSISESGPQGPRGNMVLTGTTDPSPIVGLIGDLYINVSTGVIFGPKTELGWGVGVEIGGETGGIPASAFGHTHYQVTPSTVWTIPHTLVFNPNITVVDLTGKVIEGDYEYSGSTIIATFSESITGAAYLS